MFPEDIWYILPTFHFMFFDRYEIHIQAFLLFINGKLIICQSSSPQNYFQNMYSENTRNSTIKSNELVPRTYRFRTFSKLCESQIDISNIFPGWFHTSSCIFLRMLVIIRRSTGPDFDQICEVPEIIQKVLEYDRGP